ncbi:hypothetical protein TUBRATIS_24640 [Tubulinosema ratisbonensis]|uniref:Uncharacterized protein n=1 Tax=Tubulinosema ratisbonensis TaxID=291195 RepID=A0A437AJ62_9MICR|nr:hypothetical protein TUBRATIS_24640 [Tubulinosema ratisbonensis]
MLFFLQLRTLFSTAIKRSCSHSNSSEVEKRCKIQRIGEELEAAEALIELQNEKQKNEEVIYQPGRNLPLFLLATPFIGDEERLVRDSISGIYFILKKQNDNNESTSNQVHNSIMVSKVAYSGIPHYLLKKEFKNLKIKYTKTHKILAQNHKSKMTKLFDSLDVDLEKLKIDFESKDHFNLSFFYCLLVNKRCYTSSYVVGKNCHKLSVIIPYICSKIIYNEELCYFNTEEDSKEQTDGFLIRSNFSTIAEAFIKIQENIREYFSLLKKDSNKLKKYFSGIYGKLVKKYEINSEAKHADLYLKFNVKDFLKFSDILSFRILFPEVKMIYEVLNKEVDFCFVKRAHFFAMTLYFKFLSLKKPMLEEILKCYAEDNKINVFRCKTFLNFLFSTKMMIQVLLTRYHTTFWKQFKCFTLCNFLFFFNISNPFLRKEMDLNIFSLLNYLIFEDETNEINMKTFDSCLNLNEFPRKILQVISIPDINKLSILSSNKYSFIILINEIDKIINAENTKVDLIKMPKENLEKIFYQKFLELIIKDFS